MTVDQGHATGVTVDQGQAKRCGACLRLDADITAFVYCSKPPHPGDNGHVAWVPATPVVNLGGQGRRTELALAWSDR